MDVRITLDHDTNVCPKCHGERGWWDTEYQAADDYGARSMPVEVWTNCLACDPELEMADYHLEALQP